MKSKMKSLFPVKFNFVMLFVIFWTFIQSANALINGQLMAFIDINADCFTDLLVNTSANSITVYVASDKEPTFQEDPRFRYSFRPNSRILNIGVGDFNGDSFPDLAVSLVYETSSAYGCEYGHHVEICYTTSENRFSCQPLSTNGSEVVVCEQPLILDCDLDQRSDLLTLVPSQDGSTMNYACFRLINGSSGQFEKTTPFELDRLPKRFMPTSNAFVDISADLNPEVVLWTKPAHGELVGLNVFAVDHGKWKLDKDRMTSPKLPDTPKLLSISKKNSNWVFGQSVYDDFNKDGKIDHLLPFCSQEPNGECTKLLLYVWINKNWNLLEIDLVDESGKQWSIFQESWGIGKGEDRRTFHVRSGDYTQDGHPDLLLILKRDQQRSAFLLENVPCPAGQECAEWKRTFRIWWHSFKSESDDKYLVNAAAFFDLTEDGTLDVILEYRNDSRRDSTAIIDFSRSVFEGDTTFLKVQVFTATCLDNCRFNREGSAISLPGAALIYTSSDTDGNPILGAYTQRSVSGYKPLLLPFALFGLGRTPNFVERLKVGAPSWPLRNQTWEQLVPNSRIYVVPYPIYEPTHWLHRLYVTPTRLIIYSAISLSSLCGLIIIIVFALHMQERRMDRKERELQKERFHFDAM